MARQCALLTIALCLLMAATTSFANPIAKTRAEARRLVQLIPVPVAPGSRAADPLLTARHAINDALRLSGFHPEDTVLPPTGRATRQRQTQRHLQKRRTTTTASADSKIAGYLQISYYVDDVCRDHVTSTVSVLSYGQCVQKSFDKSSYRTVFSLPEQGPSIVTNTTTTFTDAACTKASTSSPLPSTINDPSGAPIPTHTCTAIHAGVFRSMMINSLSQYFPLVENAGVATAVYPNPSFCNVKPPAKPIAPNSVHFVDCLPLNWTVSSTTSQKTTTKYYQGSMRYTIDESKISAVTCFLDKACSLPNINDGTACPAIATPTLQMTRYATKETADKQCPSLPSANNDYPASCLYDPYYPEDSSCLPKAGPDELPSTAAPLIAGYLKMRHYYGTKACDTSYDTEINAFGMCERNYEGIPGILSSIALYTINTQNNIEATYTYYKDTECQEKVGDAITVNLAGGGTDAVVGKCFTFSQPQGENLESFFLESVTHAPPSLDYTGIVTTGYQSESQCNAGVPTSVTRILLKPIGYCLKDEDGITSMSTCNSTTVITHEYKNPVCGNSYDGDAPTDVPTITYTSLAEDSCVFLGDTYAFSEEENQELYTITSCYIAPVKAADSSNDLLAVSPLKLGLCIVAIILVLSGLAGCCYYQNVHLPKKALAEQEDGGSNYGGGHNASADSSSSSSSGQYTSKRPRRHDDDDAEQGERDEESGSSSNRVVDSENGYAAYDSYPDKGYNTNAGGARAPPAPSMAPPSSRRLSAGPGDQL